MQRENDLPVTTFIHGLTDGYDLPSTHTNTYPWPYKGRTCNKVNPWSYKGERPICTNVYPGPNKVRTTYQYQRLSMGIQMENNLSVTTFIHRVTEGYDLPIPTFIHGHTEGKMTFFYRRLSMVIKTGMT